ncbi:MAG TPA: methyl-accepting chemotaxis protein [Deltaproteobacteria bacterium]|nr:methyl-accepting chemotaxis protein [Deltaproteobacteria bacterium]
MARVKVFRLGAGRLDKRPSRLYSRRRGDVAGRVVMSAEKGPEKRKKSVRQRFFVSRELQLTIALLVIMAMLGAIFLQSLSRALAAYYGVQTPALGIFLILGYMAIVVFLAVFFSHRLIGPFKRLEYEMRLISSGELTRRLHVRGRDDIHVRNFVSNLNAFIEQAEEMSRSFNELHGALAARLAMLQRELARKDCDMECLKREVSEIQEMIHRFREKW